MHSNGTTPTAMTFGRDACDSTVAVVDGYGLSIRVLRGHLVVADGIGRHRRQRRYSRVERTLRRLVVLGDTGYLSLEAIRWCADVGVALLQLDRDGRVLLCGANPARTDARLIRAQASAAGTDVGVAIARLLLVAKLLGHADLAAGVLDQPLIAATLRELATRLHAASTLTECRDVEAQAANIYFAGWVDTVRCRFAERVADRVPEHWRHFSARRSQLNRGASPRNAADPVNALLNFGYALAETEGRLAALALGLDPGLGITHTDQKGRDSFALDLVEVLRPVVERHVLQLLTVRTFRADDFVESRDGRCRLLAPLTHELAEQLIPELTRAVALPAEGVAHLLADSSPGDVALRTPLSRANTTGAQLRGRRSQHAQPPRAAGPRPNCQKCGVDLYGSARKLCPTCWPVQRREYMRQLGKARRGPAKPVKTSVEELSGGITLERYQTEILPRLAGIPLPEIEQITGLSNSTCSRLTRGLQVPNPRHWPALRELGRRWLPADRRSGGAMTR